MQKEVARRDCLPIKVYCLPEERIQLQANAEATGLSLSLYLRRVGIGYKVQSILDHRYMHDLAKTNGDLGRLGGLLKLWLTNDPRIANISSTTLRALLAKIEATQDEIRVIMKKVLKK